MVDLIHKQEVYDIVGACFNVYNTLGHGLLEAVYQEALEIEMEELEIPFNSQARLNLNYRGRPLKQVYIPDFICHNKVIIEVKSAKTILPEHEAQLFNYLRITGLQVGLLVNFGNFPKLDYRRVVCTEN